ncbi:MAG: multidrug efflux MFS transporter [Deinococcales bacterium]|nr:multidrug efflux MFS transporter [Deinococcales bacterium]
MKPRWQRTLGVMFVAQLLASVGFSTIFPFLPNYVEHLGVRGGGSLVFWVSAVFSVQAVSMMFAAPIWGAVADRYGRKLMVVRSLIGGAVIILLMGFARSAEELTLLRLIQGLVTGVMSASSSLVASVTPRERLGYAMGLMQTANWAGVSVGPMIGGVLEFFFGYRIAFVVTAALLLLGGVLVMVRVEERFTRPESVARGVSGVWRSWGLVVRAPGVLLAYLLRFLAWLGRTMLTPFLPLFVAAIAARPEVAGLYTGLAIGLASAAGTLSGVVLGRLSDRVGSKPVLVVSAVATALFYVPLTFVTEVWQLVVLNTLVGFAVGGVLPAISAMLARLTDPSEAGTVYGLDTSIGSASRAVAPLVAGAIVTLTSAPGETQYRYIFLAAGALFLLAAGLAAWRLPKPEAERARAAAAARPGAG